MHLVLLSILSLLASSPPSSRILQPCEIVRDGAELAGKIVSTRAVVIAGPHDDYLVAKGCGQSDAVDYIVLDLAAHPREMRKLVHQLSSSHTPKQFPTATITGKVFYSPESKYGTVGAHIYIEVLSASDISN